MSTALDLIRKGIAWDGRRLTAELWKVGSKTDPAIATERGQQPARGPGHPTGQMCHFQHTQRHGQEGRGVRQGSPGYRSSIQCYSCHKWGHIARVCTSRSREVGGQIKPNELKRQGEWSPAEPAKGEKKPKGSMPPTGPTGGSQQTPEGSGPRGNQGRYQAGNRWSRPSGGATNPQY